MLQHDLVEALGRLEWDEVAAVGEADEAAPGTLRASSAPLAGSTTRSRSPWTTRVGAAISSTGRLRARKSSHAAYCAAQHSGGVGNSSREASSDSYSPGCRSVQPGAKE